MLGTPRRPVALLCFAAALSLLPLAPARASVASTVRGDADWLMQAVAHDGAIGTWIDRAWVVPYRSNFAAMGLARATMITGDARYATAAWNWLDWYQAHMDANGFVTDYQWTASGWRSTGDMDSTDAYAGTFLSALRETLRATGDLTRLSRLRTGLSRAVSAIAATADADGLHFAKPGWPFKYVMDEAENYAGLLAAADVATTIGDLALAARARDDANRIRASIGTFWNASQRGFDWGMHANGVKSALEWREMYPSATAQIWAIAFGLIEGSAATRLFDRFDAAQPNWDRPAETTWYPWGWGKVDYWPVGGIAALRAGRPERARAAAASIRAAALAANRYWPFTTAEAGELILLDTDGMDRAAPLQPIATALSTASDPNPSAPRVAATVREVVTGRVVPGVRVTFYALDAFTGARGSRICEATTDGAGTARCAADVAGVALGGFEAVFSGTPIYRPAQARHDGALSGAAWVLDRAG